MGLDSVEMVLELEDEFDLRIPDQDAERLRTVGQVMDYVADRLDLRSTPSGICPTARFFRLLRRELLATFSHLKRDWIRPSMPIRDLLSRRKRAEFNMRLLQSNLPATHVPKTCRTIGDFTMHLVHQSVTAGNGRSGDLDSVHWRVRQIIGAIVGSEAWQMRRRMRLGDDVGMD